MSKEVCKPELMQSIKSKLIFASEYIEQDAAAIKESSTVNGKFDEPDDEKTYLWLMKQTAEINELIGKL